MTLKLGLNLPKLTNLTESKEINFQKCKERGKNIGTSSKYTIGK